MLFRSVTLDGVTYVAQEWEDPQTATHYYLAADVRDYHTIIVTEARRP